MGYFYDDEMETSGSSLGMLEEQQEQFVSERNGVMDVLHDLWAGTGDALRLYGQGLGSEDMVKAGEWVSSTGFARPDISQYYGTQSRFGRVRDMIFRSAPTTLGVAGAGLAGSLAGGPVGTVAGVGSALGVIGKGTYEESVNELRERRPELDEDTIHRYGLVNAVSEVGSEALSTIIPFGGGKLLGKLSKPGQKALMETMLDTGRISANEVVGQVVKNVGGKQAIGGLFGSAVADGTGEVANELVQAANRESVGLDERPVDLIDVFLAGSAPGGATMAGTLMLDNRAKAKVRDQLTGQLLSDDIGERQAAKGMMVASFTNIHPDLGAALDQNLDVTAPVDLSANLMEKKEQTVEEQIIDTPEKVVEAAGIPTKKDEGFEPPALEPLPEERARDASLEYLQEKNRVGEPTPVDPRAAQIAEGMAVLPEDSSQLAEPIRTPEEVAAVKTEQDIQTAMDQWNVSRDEATEIVAFEDASTAYRQSKNEEIVGLTAERQQAYVDGLMKAKDDMAKTDAIRMGMREVVELTNELKQPGKTLKERKKIEKQIEETSNLVEEALEVPVVAEIKPEKAPEKPVVKPKAEPKPTPAPPKEKPVVKPTVTPSPKAVVKTERAGEITAEELGSGQVRLTNARTGETTEVSKGVAQKALEAAKKIEKTAPEAVTGTTPIVDEGTTTKGKKWKVTDPKTATVYRAATNKERDRIVKALEKGEDPKAELWEKERVNIETRKITELTEDQKDQAAEAAGNVELMTDVGKKVKSVVNAKRGNISADDQRGMVFEAVAMTVQEGKKPTAGNIMQNAKKLVNRAINISEETKGAKEGVKVQSSMGGREMFKGEEAQLSAEGIVQVKATKGKEEAAPTPEATVVEAGKNKVSVAEDGTYTVTSPDGKELATGITDPMEAMQWNEPEVKAVDDSLFSTMWDNWTDKGKREPAEVIKSMLKTFVSRDQMEPMMQKVFDQLNAQKEMVESFRSKNPDALTMLENIAKPKIGTGLPHVEASRFFLKSEPMRKALANVPVIPVARGDSYYQNGKIYINVNKHGSSPTYKLHEIVHGATVEQMKADPKMKAEVTKMLEKARAQAVKDYWVTPEEMARLKDAKTSNRFQADGNWGNRDIAYGLLNEQEFLSQVFNKPDFANFLKGIQMEKKSLWKRLVDTVAKAFGITGREYTMLEEVISIIPQIADVDPIMVQNSKDAPALADDYVVSTADATAAIMKSEGAKGKVLPFLADQGKEIKRFAEVLARPVSDMVRVRSEKIYSNLMKMEARLMTKQREYSSKVTPFLSWYKKLDREQQVRYSLALMNSQTKDNQKIIDEIPKDVYKPMKDVLDDLFDRAEAVGLVHGEQKEYYYPRRVKDVMGFMDASYDGEVKGYLGAAFEKEAQRRGRELTDAEKAQIVTDQFQSGYFRQLPRPGSSKERSVDFVSPETFKFYNGASDALTSHIFEMNEKIGQREFIGGSNRKKKLQSLLSDHKKIEKMESGDAKDLAIEEYDRKADELENIEEELQGELGAMIVKEMGDKPAVEQKEMNDLINARLRQKGAYGVTDAFRNLSYMTTMGNFLSAITQLGDIPILFYAHGFNKDSVASVGEAFKEVYKIARGEITGKELKNTAFVDQADFTNTLREFSEGKVTAELLEKVFQYSGLKYTDLIGKEAFMRAAYKKYQRKGTKDAFMKRYEPMFGKDTEGIYKDIQLGKRSDDITAVLISELSDYQPVSLSQQSQGYLGAGNMRIFYMLKTFTLRATSAALREGVTEAQKGNYAKAAMKFSGIIMLYSLAGAGTDEMRDILRGRESSFSDNTFDNILQMFFLSKYSLEKGTQQESVFKAITNNLMPPVRFMDTLGADTYAMFSEDKEQKFKSLSMVPLFGSIAFGQSTAGQASFAKQERKAILEAVKSNKEKRRGAYSGNLSRDIRAYNKKVPAEERITNDAVMRAYRSK